MFSLDISKLNINKLNLNKYCNIMLIDMSSNNYCTAIVKKTNQRCKNKCKFENLCTIHFKVKRKNQCVVVNNYYLDTNAINACILIQKIIRSFIVQTNIKQRGISCYARHLCNNKTEFMKFTSINSIKISEYFGFVENGLHWGFDILSFKMILNKNMKNPYTTHEITELNKNKFSRLIFKIEKIKKVEMNDIIPNNKYISIQQECVRIFQIMDTLKNYTKCKWFLDLNLCQLKELYKQLEDIWNYRLNLSTLEKFKYTNDGKLFKMNVKNFYKINNIHTAQTILLSEFERLVTEGKSESDKCTASQWILSALTLVHEDARISLPWLYQSASLL